MKMAKFVSNYLKTDSVKVSGPIRGEIVEVREETVRDPVSGEGTEKAVLFLSTCELGLILNKSNIAWLTETCCSDESDDWVGHDVEIYYDPTIMFGGVKKGGLRLRVPSLDLDPVGPVTGPAKRLTKKAASSPLVE